MTTNLPRLNLTLPVEMMATIQAMAKNSGESASAVARRLLDQALEVDEDAYYIKLIEDRKLTNTKLYTHEEAWGIEK